MYIYSQMPVPFTTLAGWHDVFQEILNHLEPRDSYDEDDENDVYFAAYKAFRGTLFSLALSSQALSDPSLDKLWRSPGNISPLFKLLPNYRLSGLTHVSYMPYMPVHTYVDVRVSPSSKPFLTCFF